VSIEVWAWHLHDSKFLSQIDRFCKRAVKYGYTAKFTPIADLIRERDLKLWNKGTTYNHCLNDLLPMKRTRRLPEGQGPRLRFAACWD